MSPAEIMMWDREFKERPLFGGERLLGQIVYMLATMFSKNDALDIDTIIGWTYCEEERVFMDEVKEKKTRQTRLERAARISGLYQRRSITLTGKLLEAG